MGSLPRGPGALARAGRDARGRVPRRGRGVIAVLGATGTTGHAVVRELVERGERVRGVSRTEEGVAALGDVGAEGAVADLRDPGSVERALRGAERIYLASPLGPELAGWDEKAVRVGECAGGCHCARLGVLGQSEPSPSRFARVHAEATEALQGSSLR